MSVFLDFKFIWALLKPIQWSLSQTLVMTYPRKANFKKILGSLKYVSYILQDIRHIYKCLDECLQNNTKSWFVRDISTTQKNQIISQINSLLKSYRSKGRSHNETWRIKYRIWRYLKLSKRTENQLSYFIQKPPIIP